MKTRIIRLRGRGWGLPLCQNAKYLRIGFQRYLRNDAESRFRIACRSACRIRKNCGSCIATRRCSNASRFHRRAEALSAFGKRSGLRRGEVSSSHPPDTSSFRCWAEQSGRNAVAHLGERRLGVDLQRRHQKSPSRNRQRRGAYRRKERPEDGSQRCVGRGVLQIGFLYRRRRPRFEVSVRGRRGLLHRDGTRRVQVSSIPSPSFP